MNVKILSCYTKKLDSLRGYYVNIVEKYKENKSNI